MSDIIEVGQHSERVLLDYMADGSTVGKLMFHLSLHRILVQRQACENTLVRSWNDCEELAVDVRESAFRRLQTQIVSDIRKTTIDPLPGQAGTVVNTDSRYET